MRYLVICLLLSGCAFEPIQECEDGIGYECEAQSDQAQIDAQIAQVAAQKEKDEKELVAEFDRQPQKVASVQKPKKKVKYAPRKNTKTQAN